MKRLTNEEKEWLKENANKYYLKDLTDLFNSTFNANKDRKNMRLTLINNGIKKTEMVNNTRPKNTKSSYKYTIEHINWLKEHREKYVSLEEMKNDFNKKFDFNTTVFALKGLLYKNNIKTKTNIQRHPHWYSDEEKQWILDNYDKYIENENFMALDFIKDFNKKFDLCIKPSDLTCLFNRTLGIKKPHSHANYLRYNVGRERKIGAFWFVKVDNKPKGEKGKRPSGVIKDRYNYRKKAHILYEQYHNVVVNDKTHCVVHIDNNYDNFDIDNLYLMTQEAYKIYTATRYKNQTKETRFNALKVSEILALTKE